MIQASKTFRYWPLGTSISCFSNRYVVMGILLLGEVLPLRYCVHASYVFPVSASFSAMIFGIEADSFRTELSPWLVTLTLSWKLATERKYGKKFSTTWSRTTIFTKDSQWSARSIRIERHYYVLMKISRQNAQMVDLQTVCWGIGMGTQTRRL